MPRARLKQLPIPIIAASPAVIADLLQVRPDDIARGTESGALPVYIIGNRRRILIEDATAWVKSWPHVKQRNIPHAR